jgi:hypothetical protein
VERCGKPQLGVRGWEFRCNSKIKLPKAKAAVNRSTPKSLPPSPNFLQEEAFPLPEQTYSCAKRWPPSGKSHHKKVRFKCRS